MSLAARVGAISTEYPGQFWTLFWGSLINSAGGGLVFPFVSLYLTKQLGFSMTDVGVIFALFAVTGVASQIVGGILVDRMGRKPVMVFSLVAGAAAVAGLGVASDISGLAGTARVALIYAVVVAVGVTTSVFGPAVQAMVADLVEQAKRSQAYGLLRVVQNLGVAIGPAIGGFIATRSYFVLFVVAALSSLLFGLIIAFRTKETRPRDASRGQEKQDLAASMSFGPVLRDRLFMAFGLLYLISQIVYSQMNTTLPVYLNRSYGVSEEWYGFLMSLNAAMVVLFQFGITRYTDRFPRAAMLALGSLLYAVGFGMFGFVGALPLFFLAQAVWTTGEMVSVPVAQAFVADVAPETMRGRYMAAYGLAIALAYGIGPLLGGAVMDLFDGRYIWYGAFILDGLVVVGFLWLGMRMARGRPGQVEKGQRLSELRG